MSKKRLRILIVTGIYPTARHPHSGTFIKSQVDSLIAEGLEVEVIHPRPGPVPLRYTIAVLKVFLKTLNRDFDIVHGHYGLWCLAASMQWTTPVVASFLGDDLLGTPTARGVFSKKSVLVVHISRWLCRYVQAVIVKSKEMKKATSRKDVFIIPNGVDFELFRPLYRSETRTLLGWEQDRYYVLFANDPDIPRKNFALAHESVECLRARGISVELVVANGLPQSKLVQYINASNVLILPSIAEGSPNVVKEAMACNVPVVATDVGDVAEVISQTEGCSVCPPNPEVMASGLEMALQHTEATTGRADIVYLENSVIAKRVIALYEQAMQKNRQ